MNGHDAAMLGGDRLSALLGLLAERDPGRAALVFLGDGEAESLRITRGGLHREAMRVAEALRRHRLVGERVLLAFHSSPECVAALLGCLYAGAVAVPACPPRREHQLRLLAALVRDAGARAVLTTDVQCADLQRRLAGTAGDAAPVLGLGTLTAQVALDHPGWLNDALRPGDLAYLQYTSGSTSTPKGVMVSHANLLANCRHLAASVAVEGDGSFVSWLPLHHDMGLVAGLLMPLTLGATAVLMPPAAFIQRPLRWLQALAAYRACFSAAPNFAYELCAALPVSVQADALDLSSWRVALNGAEPLRAATLDRFQARFAGNGLHAGALCGGYGLAEATLAVTAGPPGQGPRRLRVQAQALARGRVEPCAEGGVVLVSSGQLRAEGCSLRIVRPDDGRPCGPLQVGEVWLHGPSIAAGYWGWPHDTAATFRATLDGEPQRRWLRSGDLGFVHEGQLFITGRLKDLIVVRGANHYPQDLEQTALSAHPDLCRGGLAAAFMLDEEAEAGPRVAVVLEMDRLARHQPDGDAIGRRIADAVAEAHGIELGLVVLLPPGGVPRTSSGKVRRRACRAALLAGDLRELARWPRAPAAVPVSDRAAPLADWLRTRVAALARRPLADVSPRRPFAELGLDSAQIVALSGELSSRLDRRLPASLLFDHPNIEAMAAHLENHQQGHADQVGAGAATGPAAAPATAPSTAAAIAPATAPAVPIAVVGMACRLPGADDLAAFWQLLAEGRDAVREVDAERRRLCAWPPGVDAPHRHAGLLDDVAAFDAALFGISPREARLMDPQQRLLLETTWRALEHACIEPASLRGSATGVFVGISSNDYYRLICAAGVPADAHAGTGGALSMAANRLSYCFGLQGPSLAIDTACSSSLVAIHQACTSLAAGESRLALAGGVNLVLAEDLGAVFSRAGMLARDGRCKTFDAAADGYVRGEGCGVLVLQRLDLALREGRPVLGVIAGSAVNQDGASNGLTAPNGLAQQQVVRRALQQAGVPAAAIDAVETHGTGTALGDPIEVQALRAVLDAPASAPCWLGALKTQIGHLEAAAGVAGVIKLLLALRHGVLPGNLHFKSLNPHIDLAGSRLRPLVGSVAWPGEPGRPRRAGISAFGFGGTNAHLVLEEAPAAPAAWAARAPWPARPFERQRHWFSAPAAVADAADPALPAGRRLDLASEAVVAYDTTVSAGSAGELLQHVVAGVALMPAAGWIVMAIDALQRAPLASAAGLEDVSFERPLPVAGAAALQTVLTRERSGWAVDIRKRAPGEADWQCCMRAVAAGSAPASPAWVPAQDVDGAAWVHIDGEAFYASLQAIGLAYGPAFRLLQTLRRQPGLAEGRLQRPPAAPGPLPVPWLDAALQAVAAALGGDLRPAQGVPVPVAMRRMHWDGSAPADGMVVQARLCERQPLWAVADVQILHADGSACLQVEGLRVQWTPPSSLAAREATPEGTWEGTWEGTRGIPEDASAASPRSGLPPLDTLLRLDPAQALAALRQGVADLLRQVLQLDDGQLPHDADRLDGLRLSSLGVDSLAAMELREHVLRWLGAELPARDLVGGGVVGNVIAQLHQHLLLKRLGMPADPDGAAPLEVVVL